MAQVRNRGKLAIVICSNQFATLAKNQARINAHPELPLVLIDHPIGGLPEKILHDRVAQAVPQVLAQLRKALGHDWAA